MMDTTLEDDLPSGYFKAATLRLHESPTSTVVDNKPDSSTTEKESTTTKELTEIGEKLEEQHVTVNSLDKAGDSTTDDKWSASVLTSKLKEKFDDIVKLPIIPSCTGRSDTRVIMEPCVLPLVQENANNYFTFREGIVRQAVDDCVKEIVTEQRDGTFIDKFLLTEISKWDSDKERLIIITERALFAVKYDFIALTMLEHRRIDLRQLDEVIVGDLVYPTRSLVPRINGLVDGFSGAVQTCFFTALSKGEVTVNNSFEPRDRNMNGVRLMWNHGKPLSFGDKWNPFSNEIPMITFTSHPLYFHKECEWDDQRRVYDIDCFHLKLGEVLGALERSAPQREAICIVKHADIELGSYVGIGSMIHNRNALGYFKVRGKFSF